MDKNNLKKEDRKKTLFICFLSGKGGTGKTSIALSMARLLSYMHYKTIVIDMDFLTHGASYFFTEEYEAQEKIGLLELLKKINEFKNAQHIAIDSLNKLIIEIHDKFHFIPSKKVFKEKTWELSQNNILISEFIEIIIKHINSLGYEFVIIDSQAGPTASAKQVCKHSKKAIIISEPDPISVAASKSLYYEMHEYLPDFTRFLVNKLNIEEVKSFIAIKDYLTIFEHISPLPFDFSVRKAFSLRKIPIDLNNPSPFLFGILKLAKEILPITTWKVADIEKRHKIIILGEIKEKRDKTSPLIDKLSNSIQYMREKQLESQARFRKKIAVFISGIIAMMATLFILYAFNMLPAYKLSISKTALIAIAISLFSLFPIAFERLRYKLTRESSSIDVEIERIKANIREIKREKERYEAILLEKSDKYMIEND